MKGRSRSKRRTERERATLEAMIALFCRERHKTAGKFCLPCQEMLTYAQERLDRCPYKNNKPVCSRCPTPCYRSEMRDSIRSVMRYAGPRMLKRHPLLALRHIFDKLNIKR